mmetsp:Transcript_10228/g.25941  ORF Transcript_10228/g.25941 Transcript_10228/m.25941 type:complete len:889 (+) Transcript_10228:130-2796(+)
MAGVLPLKQGDVVASTKHAKDGKPRELSFKVTRKLGEGQFALVYQCQDACGKKVALKIEKSPGAGGLDKEASMLQALKDCPAIPRLHLKDKHKSHAFLVMEYGGCNLYDYRVSHPRDPPARPSVTNRVHPRLACAIAFCAIDGLSKMHRRGYIHRDVKPANVLLKTDAQQDTTKVCLIDFGISKQISSNAVEGEPKPDHFRGTTAYASVNSHRGLELSPRDDLWSLFYILVEMCTGTLPWRTPNGPCLEPKDRVLEAKLKCMRNPNLYFEGCRDKQAFAGDLSPVFKDIVALAVELAHIPFGAPGDDKGLGRIIGYHCEDLIQWDDGSPKLGVSIRGTNPETLAKMDRKVGSQSTSQAVPQQVAPQDRDHHPHWSHHRDRDRDRERERRSPPRHRSHHRDDSRRGDRDRDRDRGRRDGRDYHRDRDHYSRDRDRDRRSRRSRSRSRSRSYSPPRERRRRRETGFDKMPDGTIGRPPVGASPAFSSQPPAHGGPGPQGHGYAHGIGHAHGNPNPYRNGVSQVHIPQGILTQQATRHARRVYVGNLPHNVSEPLITRFFSNALQAIGGTRQTGDPVVNVYINYEKRFSFVEFRTVEETSNAMALDGILFEGTNARVRRPNDYNPAMAASLGPSAPSKDLKLESVGLRPGGYVSAGDSPDRIFVGGIPYYLTEDQCRELLQQFGAVRAFDLVRDKETGNSKGYGFAVYEDPNVTDAACQGLNGLRMGDKTLTVRRAAQGAQHQQQQQMSLMAAQQAAQLQQQAIAALSSQTSPTTVVRLRNCVTIDELRDDEEFEAITEDMQEETGKYGGVVKIVIPRPAPRANPPQPGDDPSSVPQQQNPPGTGNIFVQFSDVDGAKKAFQAMTGRKFGGNIVVVDFIKEEDFQQGKLDG